MRCFCALTAMFTVVWLLSQTACGQDIELPKTAISIGKPVITGKGPYTVSFEGTARVGAYDRKFVGVSMVVKPAGAGEEIGLSVNLPKASPKPGQERPVRFTATKLPRGPYTGKVRIEYQDEYGKPQKIERQIDEFKVP